MKKLQVISISIKVIINFLNDNQTLTEEKVKVLILTKFQILRK